MNLLPIHHLRNLLQKRSLSPTELLEETLQNVSRHNEALNAIIWPDFDAARAQAKVQTSRPESYLKQPLGGIPMTVKDGINVAGLPTTGGISQPRDSIAAVDAPVVAAVRGAGAVIIGKTNVPTANADWQCQNAVFGQSHNPWNLDLVPGGSTGGGAAAVAAGLSCLELGSDIGGSIRVPAAFCGIYGHKPSMSAVPRTGHYPGGNLPVVSNVLGLQGPLTRSARDLEIALQVIAGPEGLEARGWRLELPLPRHQALADYRVAVLELPEWLPVDREIAAAQTDLVEQLARLGCVVSTVNMAPFGGYDTYYEDYLITMQAIIGAGLPQDRRRDLIERFQHGDDPFLVAVAQGLSADATLLQRKLLAAMRYRQQWTEVFKDVDVVLMPVMNVCAYAPKKQSFYDRIMRINAASGPCDMPYYRLSALAGVATMPGLPATAFPTGRLSSDGVPIGLQVMGDYLDDLTTIGFAAHLEAEFGAYEAPPMVCS